MSSYNPEFNSELSHSGLAVSRPLPPVTIKESLIPLQDKDPVFFAITCGIVSDDLHNDKSMSRHIGRLVQRYDGGSRSVNNLYRSIDRANETLVLASPEVVRYVIRTAVMDSRW